jgi:twitching motility protein PilT
MMDLTPLLEQLIERGGSDLHLQPGDPPVIRVQGDLIPLDGHRLSREDTQAAFEAISAARIREDYSREGAADFSHELPGRARFRVNAFRERGDLAMVFRHIPAEIPAFETLGLPDTLLKIAMEPRGLVLVVGVTGSGKTTTLAVKLNHINVHQDCRSLPSKTRSNTFTPARKASSASASWGSIPRISPPPCAAPCGRIPTCLLGGELRDLETIRTAVRAAETGHLVFRPLHTNDTVQTLDRLIGYYPAEERDLARMQVALNLRAVIAQRLVRAADGKTRLAAVEILVNNSLVQKMLLNNKVRELYEVLKNRQDGMQSFDQCLLDMVKAGKVTEEESMNHAVNPAALKRMISGGVSDSDRGGILGF